MQIWPAIDIRGGKCVRLVQGDYDREIVFGDEPAEVAQRLVGEGADRLHVVDLDGARRGRPENWSCIESIVRVTGIPCQLGGGIRDEQSIRRGLDVGIWRFVVGTRAVQDPAWFQRVCSDFPEQLALGIDARDGLVATDGWERTSTIAAADLVKEFKDLPIGAVIFTDIMSDGMLSGPNIASLTRFLDAVDRPVIASGGVSSKADVERLSTLPLAGCIIGRALYEGKLTLAEALAAAGQATLK
jgi:phosphoribosylformimino-5-aminoimidazole carboxamide ribotide isomerase